MQSSALKLDCGRKQEMQRYRARGVNAEGNRGRGGGGGSPTQRGLRWAPKRPGPRCTPLALDVESIASSSRVARTRAIPAAVGSRQQVELATARVVRPHIKHDAAEELLRGGGKVGDERTCVVLHAV
eukprot:6203514-Pleurochrysis_carterae.AAC.2